MLDIGTGCGLIALMMAQRNSTALIDAIEIDEAAAQQASENVVASPWSDRIEVFNISLKDFTVQSENAHHYDFIVCNPPFFSRSTISQDVRSSTARHDQCLKFDELFEFATRLLRSEGRLALILPFDRLNEVVDLALARKLAVTRTTEVSPMAGRQPNRLLIELEFGKPSRPGSSRLEIYRNVGTYSDEYRTLTRDYYLPETFAVHFSR